MADADGRGWTLVTGGTGGLGVAVVRALDVAGHRVVATWLVPAEEAGFPEDLRGRVRLVRLDVTDPAAVAGCVRELEADGGLVAVAHLVGGYRDGTPLAALDMDVWERQMALNARSAAIVIGASVAPMAVRGRGAVVAIGARAALRPFAGAGAYAASKAAVVATVAAASEEVRDAGVRVNCVLPSVIDTPANRAAQPDVDPGRWVRPEQIADVVAFLLSPAASAVTGAAIPVYGRA